MSNLPGLDPGHDEVSRRNFLRNVGITGAGVAALPFLSAACGGSTSAGGAPPTTARLTLNDVLHAKGTVKILGSAGYQVAANNPPGLTSQWGYNTTNEQIITKTQIPGTFDFVIIYQGEIDQLLELHRIQPIDISLIPNWRDMDPYFQNNPLFRRNGHVYEVPYHWGYGYCEYNASHVRPPHSFSDLMSPALKKKIALPDDPYAVITTFAIILGVLKPPYPTNNLTQSQLNTVMAALNKLKSQVVTIIQYGQEPPLFGRQDILVALPMYSNSIVQSRKAGANVSFTRLGSFTYVDGFQILNPDNYLAGTYAYINHALTADAQKASTKFSQALPVNNAAISMLPKQLQYTSVKQIFAEAPLMPGVTVKTNTQYVPFSGWLSAWEQYKAGV
jgi:spermidine/putrescine transport system substrate-binding protein